VAGGEVGYDQSVGRRITVALDDHVTAKIEAEIRKSGKSLKQTMNETLRLGLRAQRQAKPFRIRARDMKLRPGYSLDKPWDLIEEIEGPVYK
jgi:hypothetical protein